MAKPCPVCQHPSRAAIDQALLNGKPQRQVAATFGFTYLRSSDGTVQPNHKPIGAHLAKCMPDAYQAAMDEAKTGAGALLIARLQVLDEAVDKVLELALEGEPVESAEGVPFLDSEGQPLRKISTRNVLASVREARANLEVRFRLSGATPDADENEREAARRAIADPKVRQALADLDDLMAEAESRTLPS